MSTAAELITSLLLWISLNSGYNLPQGAPEIARISHDSLSQMACAKDCPVLGFYPDSKYENPFTRAGVRRIYLDQRMNLEEDICAVSILVHELVHYVQEENNAFEEIGDPKERYIAEEIEAHQIQAKYLYQKAMRGNSTVRVISNGSKLILIC